MAQNEGKVLFIDDDESILFAAELLLKREVKRIRTESRPERIPEILGDESFDAIFLDMNFTGGTTSGKEGFHWLKTILRLNPDAIVILMTAFGDVEMAVRAIKHGATDFILKPWQNEKLISSVQAAVRNRRAKAAPSESQPAPAQSSSDLKQELEYASAVQARLLPQNPPPLRHLDYAAVCKSARGVGGDYYDFIDLGRDRMGVALGDVSGKGISAALLMASLQGCLQSYAPQHGESVDTLLADVNRLVATSTDASRFITFFYGFYHDYTRQLTYVNAGHLPPMLFRNSEPDAELERLGTGGAVIGVFPELGYQKATEQLHPGDILVLFTDGVSEAMNHAEEEYGEERLRDLVRSKSKLPAGEIVNAIVEEIESFADNATLRDDLTVIVAKVR